MTTHTKLPAILLLADGTVYHGKAAGKIGTTTGEICFNTGMRVIRRFSLIHLFRTNHGHYECPYCNMEFIKKKSNPIRLRLQVWFAKTIHRL